mgnify:CR=1 FL=1
MVNKTWTMKIYFSAGHFCSLSVVHYFCSVPYSSTYICLIPSLSLSLSPGVLTESGLNAGKGSQGIYCSGMTKLGHVRRRSSYNLRHMEAMVRGVEQVFLLKFKNYWYIYSLLNCCLLNYLFVLIYSHRSV